MGTADLVWECYKPVAGSGKDTARGHVGGHVTKVGDVIVERRRARCGAANLTREGMGTRELNWLG